MSVMLLLAAMAVEPLYVHPDAVELREHVLTWSESLRSFEGYYVINDHAPGETVLIEGAEYDFPAATHQYEIYYAFDGHNRIIKHLPPGTLLDNPTGVSFPVRFPFSTNAVYEGDVTRLTHTPDADVRYKAYINRDEWRRPMTAPILPEHLFGYEKPSAIPEILRTGETRRVERDGHEVLFHWGMQHDVDVWVNNEGLITRIDYVGRIMPKFAGIDELREHWDGDLFDLRSMSKSIRLANHQLINGVWFPTQAYKTYYGLSEKDRDSWRAFVADMDARGASHAEVFVADATMFPREPQSVTEFTLIDPESTSINTPLPSETFQIDIPPSATIIDEAVSEQPSGGGDNRTRAFIWKAVIIMAILLFFASLEVLRRRYI